MIIPVSECLKGEDHHICGWFGMCSTKGIKMCQIQGKGNLDTIKKRIKFAESCLTDPQRAAMMAIARTGAYRDQRPPSHQKRGSERT